MILTKKYSLYSRNWDSQRRTLLKCKALFCDCYDVEIQNTEGKNYTQKYQKRKKDWTENWETEEKE